MALSTDATKVKKLLPECVLWVKTQRLISRVPEVFVFKNIIFNMETVKYFIHFFCFQSDHVGTSLLIQ